MQQISGVGMLTILYNFGNIREAWLPQDFIAAGEYCYAEDSNIIDVLGIDAINYIKGYDIGTRVTPQKVVKEEKETIIREIQKVAEDDGERRKETIVNIGDIDYDKGKELSKLDKTYDDTWDYSWVSDNTHMTASGKVTIDSIDVNNDCYEMNLVLREKQKVELTTKKEVSKVKITLSDGSTLIYREPDKELGKPSENNIGTMVVNPKQWLAVMDDELLHGATLEVEYKVTVNDQGNPFNGKYTVYDYIDKEVMLKEYDGWDIVTDAGEKGTLAQNVADTTGSNVNDIINLLEDKVIVKKEFDKDNPVAYLTTTRVLATNCTDEYENYVEIIKYSNDWGRRIYFTIPGNLNLKKIYNDEEIDDLEADTAKAESVNIIPPFGGEISSKAHFYEKIYLIRNNVQRFN